GWYSLHQVVEIDYGAVRRLSPHDRDELASEARLLAAELASEARLLAAELASPEAGKGWSATFRLAGKGADLLLVHFRETFDEIAAVQSRIRTSSLGPFLRIV